MNLVIAWSVCRSVSGGDEMLGGRELELTRSSSRLADLSSSLPLTATTPHLDIICSHSSAWMRCFTYTRCA